MSRSDLDEPVARALATDPQYPLGEPDAMKWAVAFRLIADRQGWARSPEINDAFMAEQFEKAMADYNGDAMAHAKGFAGMVWRNKGSVSGEIDEGLMVGWFANAMATAEMRAAGGSFLNADGMQAIIDGEIEALPELCR